MDTVLLIVIMGAALYFLMIRPQQKRAKEQKNLMEAIAVGSRIMTVSGIIGTIKHLGEKQAVLEISPGVEMTIDKRAISPQAVEDEFEYSDDADVEAVEADDAVAEPFQIEDAATVEDVSVEDTPVVDVDPADVTDPAPITWENPDTKKN